VDAVQARCLGSTSCRGVRACQRNRMSRGVQFGSLLAGDDPVVTKLKLSLLAIEFVGVLTVGVLATQT
jgi:hypothetical protein